jgi:8-oxo-dGTP pyrophosphatase MutT (NUDIX family)
MHRELILRLLDSYQIKYDSDRAQLEKVRRFVEGNPRCFERSLTEGHLTGSAWVVSPDRRRVLLTHHRKIGHWLQLGGHADGNPDIFAVARREACEESGLRNIRPLSPQIFDIDVHGIPARPGTAGHYHYDIRFIFEADPAKPLVISQESKELGWVALTSLTEPDFGWSIRRMVQKTTFFPRYIKAQG